jgi:arginyl-tRNA synthetase
MPHVLAEYLYEVAAGFHTFYEACKVVPSAAKAAEGAAATAAAGTPGGAGEVDATTTLRRLQLCAATDAALRAGLHMLGVTAAERM